VLASFAHTHDSKNKLSRLCKAWEITNEVEIGRELYIEKTSQLSTRTPVLYRWNSFARIWIRENSWEMQVVNLGGGTYYKFVVKGSGIYALFDAVRNAGKTEFLCSPGYALLYLRLVQPLSGIVMEYTGKESKRTGTLKFGHISPVARLELRLQTPKGELQLNTVAGRWMKVPFYYGNKYGLYFNASALKREVGRLPENDFASSY